MKIQQKKYCRNEANKKFSTTIEQKPKALAISSIWQYLYVFNTVFIAEEKLQSSKYIIIKKEKTEWFLIFCPEPGKEGKHEENEMKAQPHIMS